MKAPLALLATAALCAGCAGPAANPTVPPGCPATARDLPLEALYGEWQARFDGRPATATVRLERHPDYAGVRGTITRPDGSVAQLAGDIGDDAVLAIDESLDGQRISGAWSGTLLAPACGRTFTGTWRDAADESAHPFTLEKTGPTAKNP